MITQRNPIGWFEIYVQDMERAKTFYQNTFQVTLERLESPGLELWAFPPLGQPNNPGCTGALVKMKGKDSGTGGTIVYFSCGDCAVEASRAVRNGGRVQKPKESIGQYRMGQALSQSHARGIRDRDSAGVRGRGLWPRSHV